MDIRKNIYSLTTAEFDAFKQALGQMNASGRYLDFVKMHHQATMTIRLAPGENPATRPRRNSAHRGPSFGPWHRYYIREFEKALQKEVPGVTLPYWDWAKDSDDFAASFDDPKNAPLWKPDFIGGDGSGIGDFVPDYPIAIWRAVIEDSSGAIVERTQPGVTRRLGRQLGLPFVPSLPNTEDVNAILAIDEYDSPPWYQASFPSFRDALEGLHDLVHVWVSGDMLFATSPNDPVFFLHHCNVDRLWAQWQGMHGITSYVPASGGPQGHNLNADMFDLGVTGVTPSSTLDWTTLGYDYA